MAQATQNTGTVTQVNTALANLVFNPIAAKLKTRSKEEVLYKELILTGMLSIAAGDNPRIVEQKLLSYLAPRQRASQFAEA